MLQKKKIIKINNYLCGSLPVHKPTNQILRGDGNRAGGDGFRYPILIPAKTIHPHPHTQTQRVSNFCLIPIPTG